MSLLPPHAIDEFQEIWKKHYGAELPREDAVHRAHQLFSLMQLLVRGPSNPQSSTTPAPGEPSGHAEAEAGR